MISKLRKEIHGQNSKDRIIVCHSLFRSSPIFHNRFIGSPKPTRHIFRWESYRIEDGFIILNRTSLTNSSCRNALFFKKKRREIISKHWDDFVESVSCGDVLWLIWWTSSWLIWWGYSPHGLWSSHIPALELSMCGAVSRSFLSIAFNFDII